MVLKNKRLFLIMFQTRRVIVLIILKSRISPKFERLESGVIKYKEKLAKMPKTK